VSSLNDAVTFIKKKCQCFKKNLLPPSSGLGIPCGKDGLREQCMRLCERANGRRWCQEGTANMLGKKMREISLTRKRIQ
jgi:hypothetical protein